MRAQPGICTAHILYDLPIRRGARHANGIVRHGGWCGKTEIRFQLIYPNISISCTPIRILEDRFDGKRIRLTQDRSDLKLPR